MNKFVLLDITQDLKVILIKDTITLNKERLSERVGSFTKTISFKVYTWIGLYKQRENE